MRNFLTIFLEYLALLNSTKSPEKQNTLQWLGNLQKQGENWTHNPGNTNKSLPICPRQKTHKNRKGPAEDTLLFLNRILFQHSVGYFKRKQATLYQWLQNTYKKYLAILQKPVSFALHCRTECNTGSLELNRAQMQSVGKQLGPLDKISLKMYVSIILLMLYCSLFYNSLWEKKKKGVFMANQIYITWEYNSLFNCSEWHSLVLLATVWHWDRTGFNYFVRFYHYN